MPYRITWKGTDGDYFAYRRDATGRIFKPEVHVIHIMQGTLKGTDQHFNNPKVSASTHYGIGKNGEIHQYVRDEDAAWGNGLVTNPNWPGEKKHPGVNPNLYTLSYELEGMSGDVPTEEQFQALLYLLKLKSAAYGIPFEKDSFIGHYLIDPVNRAGCPGKGFPWNRLYKELSIQTETVAGNMPVLAFGSKGADVFQLQRKLKEKGFDPGPVDGDFGPMTLQAVYSFQASNGLVVDGIVGPVTWSRLL